MAVSVVADVNLSWPELMDKDVNSWLAVTAAHTEPLKNSRVPVAGKLVMMMFDRGSASRSL